MNEERRAILYHLAGYSQELPPWYRVLRVARYLSVPPWEVQEDLGVALSRREWCECAEVAMQAEADYQGYLRADRAEGTTARQEVVYSLASPPGTTPSPDPNAHLMDCQYRRTIPRAS